MSRDEYDDQSWAAQKVHISWLHKEFADAIAKLSEKVIELREEQIRQEAAIQRNRDTLASQESAIDRNRKTIETARLRHAGIGAGGGLAVYALLKVIELLVTGRLDLGGLL